MYMAGSCHHCRVNSTPCPHDCGLIRQCADASRSIIISGKVQVPMGLEDRLQGLVDLVHERAFYFEGTKGEQVCA